MKKGSYQNIFWPLLRPVATEKSFNFQKENKYVFEVDEDATKGSVKEAVEKFFGVKVKKVWIVKLPGKKRFFRGRFSTVRKTKKAIVQLKEGEKIEILSQKG